MRNVDGSVIGKEVNLALRDGSRKIINIDKEEKKTQDGTLRRTAKGGQFI